MAWLLPNHSPPWTAFHAEFFAAAVIWMLAITVFTKNKQYIKYPLGFWLVCSLVAQVCLGWFSGLIPNSGVAWMSGLYLVGLAAALRLGNIWQANSDGEAASFTFAAILLAAIVSVFLQFLQSIGYQTDFFWFNIAPEDLRMDANLAQANNLASLHLLALVGCSWLWTEKKINAPFAIFGAGILFAGLALTASRTGFLGGIIILVATPWVLMAHRGRAWTIRIAVMLGIWFLLLVAIIPVISQAMETRTLGASVYTRTVNGSGRIDIWWLAIDAILQSPWWGYGWGQVHIAQMAVASQHAPLVALNSAHNLVLDIALWGGCGTALLILAYSVWRLGRIMLEPLTLRQKHTLLGMAMLLLHSMLELPLHYAYFLLPFGILWGSLEPICPSAGKKYIWRIASCFGLVLLAGALWITALDYIKVEKAERILRLESVQGTVQVADNERIPKLQVLDQYEDFFLLSRLSPVEGLSTEQLHSMEQAVRAVPSDLILYNLAANFALNGDPERAREWMQILCKTRSKGACRNALRKWRNDGYNIYSPLDMSP